MSRSRDHKVAMSKSALLLIFTTLMSTSVSSSAPVYDQEGLKCSNGTSSQHRKEIVNAPHYIGDYCDVQGSNVKGRWMIFATGKVDCRHCCGGFRWDEEYLNCVKCPEGSTSKAGPFTRCTHVDPTESINTKLPPVGSTQSPLPINSNPMHVQATDSSIPSYAFQTSAEIRHGERPITVSLPGNNMAKIIGPIVTVVILFIFIITVVIIQVFKMRILTYLRNNPNEVAACVLSCILHIWSPSCQTDTPSERRIDPEMQPLY